MLRAVWAGLSGAPRFGIMHMGSPMKAITIYQPWARLIANGVKTIETRTWQTRYRGPLAIHAAKKIDLDGCRLWGVYTRSMLRLSAIVAIVELVDVRLCRQTDREAACGECNGRWCWILANVRPLSNPVPVSGHRKIWKVPPEVARHVKREVSNW